MAIQAAAMTNVDELPKCAQHGCTERAQYRYLWTGNWYCGCEAHTQKAINLGITLGFPIHNSVVLMVPPEKTGPFVIDICIADPHITSVTLGDPFASVQAAKDAAAEHAGYPLKWHTEGDLEWAAREPLGTGLYAVRSQSSET